MLGLEAGLCCLSLLATLGPEKVYLPGNQAYEDNGASYFAQANGELAPGCIVKPETTEQVATTIRTISTLASGLNLVDGDHQAQCRFAIRSGGHHTNAGTSNIQGGVTIDLRALNDIDISVQGIAKLGPGATWDKVYETLEPHNLTVAGGRTAGVGVGGLVSGGGMSHFGPRYGWSCDTVVNFEVVLSGGSIANANERENRDLLWALRGSGNNFGVVTRFDMKTIPATTLWGGVLLTDQSDIEERLQAYVDLNDPEKYDEYSSFWMGFMSAVDQSPMMIHAIEYTKAVEEPPPVFEFFTSRLAVLNTLRSALPSELSYEIAELQPKSVRQREATLMLACTLPMLQALRKRWADAAEALKEIPSFTSWVVLMEAVPPGFYDRNTNALGLEGRSGSFMVSNPILSWTDPKDDEKANAWTKKVYDQLVEDAKRLGAYDEFMYMNNAAPWQDIMGGYGKENGKKLRAIQRKYDPSDLFTKNVPGGFKLRAPQDAPEAAGKTTPKDEL